METKLKIRGKDWDAGPELMAKIQRYLAKELCVVRFRKADGTKREMVCTRHPSFLPLREERENEVSRVASPKQQRQVLVWDIEAEGWRSFTIDSFLRLSIVV